MRLDFSKIKPQHIRRAAQEFNRVGQKEFLERLGCTRASRTWFLDAPSKPDLKAVFARAYNLANPHRRIKTRDFNTSEAIAYVSTLLGFKLRNRR